jgi:hypothetical protein
MNEGKGAVKCECNSSRQYAFQYCCYSLYNTLNPFIICNVLIVFILCSFRIVSHFSATAAGQTSICS